VDEFFTFFTGGTDTVSHLMTIATYYYIKYPQYQEKINKEVELYMKDESPDCDNLNKMEFMHAFLKESLRLFGPTSGFFRRVALKDHKLGDINIKKGTLVNLGTLG